MRRLIRVATFVLTLIVMFCGMAQAQPQILTTNVSVLKETDPPERGMRGTLPCFAVSWHHDLDKNEVLCVPPKVAPVKPGRDYQIAYANSPMGFAILRQVMLEIADVSDLKPSDLSGSKPEGSNMFPFTATLRGEKQPTAFLNPGSLASLGNEVGRPARLKLDPQTADKNPRPAIGVALKFWVRLAKLEKQPKSAPRGYTCFEVSTPQLEDATQLMLKVDGTRTGCGTVLTTQREITGDVQVYWLGKSGKSDEKLGDLYLFEMPTPERSEKVEENKSEK
jgi:hypothetical protein